MKTNHMPRKPGVYQIVTPSGSYYIGKALNLRERAYQHYSRMRWGTHHNERLIRSYKKHGDKMRIEVLQLCDADSIDAIEAHYIQLFYDDKKCMNMTRVDFCTEEKNKEFFSKKAYCAVYWSRQIYTVDQMGSWAKELGMHFTWRGAFGLKIFDTRKAAQEWFEVMDKRSILAERVPKTSLKSHSMKRWYHVRNIHTGYVGIAKSSAELKQIGAHRARYHTNFSNGWQVRKYGEDWNWQHSTTTKIAVFGLHVTGKRKSWLSREECKRDIGNGANNVWYSDNLTYKGWILSDLPR